MFISQSAVTQQIASAEKELNIQIFERYGKKARLTDAGAVLIAGLKNILANYDTTVEQAQRMNAMASELMIGYHGPMNWGTIPSLLAEFKDRIPDIRLSVRTDHWGVLMQDLNRGLIDLVFTELREMNQYHDLKAEFLFRDYPCVCMSIKNPLAEKEVLYPDDLKGQNLIMTNSPLPSESMRAIISGLGKCGIDMDRAQYVTQLQIAITMAAADIGITFVPRSFRAYESSALRYVDLAQDQFHMDMMLAYSEKRLSRAGKEFISLCRNWNFQPSGHSETQRTGQ